MRTLAPRSFLWPIANRCGAGLHPARRLSTGAGTARRAAEYSAGSQPVTSPWPAVRANAAGAGDPPRSAALFCRVVPLLLLAAACFAEVSMPLIGYYRDRSGDLRQVHGVAGAFVPGDVLERNVIAAAWSGVAGLAKTESELLVLDANGISKRIAAPAGSAIFGFLPDGRPAWVRFADRSCHTFASNCPSEPVSKPPLRVRLPEDIDSYEQLGDGWMLARGKDSLYAVRTRSDIDVAYRLPEGEP